VEAAGVDAAVTEPLMEPAPGSSLTKPPEPERKAGSSLMAESGVDVEEDGSSPEAPTIPEDTQGRPLVRQKAPVECQSDERDKMK
jgi:hypothetical protein